jgi:hypothetical protein
MINNGHIGLHYLRNLKRKANEATNNFSGTAAGIGGSVCVNYLCPVEAVGGGMSDFWKDYEPEPSKTAPVQPVAWMTQARNFVRAMDFTEAEAKLYGWMPVYTTPPAAQRQWVGLTEQEAAECWSTSTVRTWQAIEAKLKEKNT